ncbi:helix-turn-helix domain-containing protein [Fibrivirga algicola]|uniref:Helix-turn-helix domain-containing protein n=1 Tax=Fibrivirga algicola TaxID=2950420 RepID=A0ABX0QEQ6_9BACT|nr:helix-turn-helix domain-containing protein [Fibrivirga algicola]NID09343.1 helix-turn-helix domain-containing protein [Fibrivirga algicola]
MNQQIVFTMSPDDLQAMLTKANEGFAADLRELQARTAHVKHAYTIKEVAEKIGYSVDTVRTFIKEGRRAKGGKTARLKAREITAGDYRITPADLDAFIAQF